MRKFLLIALFCVIPFGAHAQSCGCEVSYANELEYDEALLLSDSERVLALLAHLPWGPPAGEEDPRITILVNKHYVVGHHTELRVPYWTAHRLTKAQASQDRPRKNCFRRDPRLEFDVASICSDYVEPIFDRGHLVPRADMNRSEQAMINTFMFSNMAPQHPNFNQHLWNSLERRIRDWAQDLGNDDDAIWIFTGSVFDKDGDEDKDDLSTVDRMQANDGSTRVAVPTHFYKLVIKEEADGRVDTIAILLKNEQNPPSASDQTFKQHIVSIDEIEGRTGLDFGWRRGFNAERAIERSKAPDLW